MNVLYNCDDGYVPYAAVSIASLFEHNREAEQIEVFLLGKAISTGNRIRLNRLAAKYGRSIRVLPLDGFEARVRELAGEEASGGRFTMTAFARIFAAELLPESVERVLYLDCDTLICGSLGTLYAHPLSGCAAAMAMEPTIYREARDYCGLGKDAPYCNAGVILIDLRKFREENIAARSMNFLKASGGKLPFSDQDCLNAVLSGQVLILDQRYNLLSNYAYFSYRALADFAPWFAKRMQRDAWKRAKEHPAVIHFAGDERPWIPGNFNPYRKAYRHMLKALPEWEELIRSKKPAKSRIYLLCYHLINLITVILPGLRFYISEQYYQRHVCADKTLRCK